MGSLKLLLDTHVFLWAVLEPDKLPAGLRERIDRILAAQALLMEVELASTDAVFRSFEGVRVRCRRRRKERYREFGIEGLHDECRPGRPRTCEDDKVVEVITQRRPRHRQPLVRKAPPTGVPGLSRGDRHSSSSRA
jgi:hypothetical protein